MLNIDVAEDQIDGIGDAFELAALNYDFDDATHDDILTLLREINTQFSPSMTPRVAAIVLELADHNNDWRDFVTADTIVEFFQLGEIEQMVALAERVNAYAHLDGNDFAAAFVDFLRVQFECTYAD